MEPSVPDNSRKYEVNCRIMNNSDKKDRQNGEERKVQKALNDVIKVLDRHCEQGEMDKKVHDRLTKEMKRIFRESIEEENSRLEECRKE